ncbi:hypothetical protein EW145_g3917 [Phellinidium pouzarii]|uniref:Uncharacterized protein n=1 Tax=Phellinidium pouzarii TaxID=167371 RepID=A0A4S4L787_9AGAM|nr:hypothetical protein EW145_g3917 [Phellinidium pouzarii]
MHSTSTTTQPPPVGLELMPGSGVNPHTAVPLLRALLPLGVRALHLSAGGWSDDDSPDGNSTNSNSDSDSRISVTVDRSNANTANEDADDDADAGAGAARGAEASATQRRPRTRMHYRPEGMDMGGWRVWRTRADTVRAVREVANAEWAAYLVRVDGIGA